MAAMIFAAAGLAAILLLTVVRRDPHVDNAH
jgi:hypothetical protein